jgi:hypothetical protein
VEEEEEEEEGAPPADDEVFAGEDGDPEGARCCCGWLPEKYT